jgi:DNA invertase Pin-like site-specific DNA recombinase
VTGYELPDIGIAHYDSDEDYDDDMVTAWSVDRLARSLIDLLDFLRELHAKGVNLFLHQQGLDTSTLSGRAMFQMPGVFAEFERAMIRERHGRPEPSQG